MKAITREWVKKAEDDFSVLERESRVKKNPSYDGICFHAQQCAEKYLKARLVEAEKEYSKTHDLNALLDKVISIEPLWEGFRRSLAFLSDFAISYRYPGESAVKRDAVMARKFCRAFRIEARRVLEMKN